MVIGHPDVFAVAQWPHLRAIHTDKPASETEWRPSPNRVASTCQRDLGVQNLLSQLPSELAGGVVIKHCYDKFAYISTKASLCGRDHSVHKDQSQSSPTEPVFQLHRIDW